MRRIGLGIAASVVALTVIALSSIATLSPTQNSSNSANIAGPSSGHSAEFSRVAERLDPRLTNTPSPVMAVTPVPTPAPTEPPLPSVTDPPPPPAAATAPPRQPVAALPAPTPDGGYRSDYSNAIFNLINQARAQNGVPSVAANAILTASADYYSELSFAHSDPYKLNHNLDGGPGDRAWARGYCCAVGEILVTSEGSPESMVDLWLNSPAHRSIILDPQYHEIGVSCYGGSYTDINGTVSHPILCAGEFGSGGG